MPTGPEDPPLRRDAPLAQEYQKDPSEEGFLHRLNELLRHANDAEYRPVDDPPPTIIVLGAPRSGTTLVTQIIAGCLDVGYINNLIATFWQAPLYGVRLSQKVFGGQRRTSYQSQFGRTADATEPHEFGYFWSTLLGYREQAEQDEDFARAIDWDRVRLVLSNVANEFAKPVMYKTFYANFHIADFARILPNTCFIHVRRDPFENAMSILSLRRTYAGSAKEWVGIAPREIEELRYESVARQIAGQIFYLEDRIADGISKVRGRNVLSVDLADLCREPVSILDALRDLLRKNSWDTSILAEPPKSFERRAPESDPLAPEIQAELDRLFASGDGGKLPPP